MRDVAILLCVIAGFGANPADAGPAEAVAALRQRVDALEARLEALEAARAPERRLTASRALEVRALVGDLLAEADARAAGLSAEATSGWKNGFFLGSADGNFQLKVRGRIQVRFAFNHRNGAPIPPDDSGSFVTRRVTLWMTGHLPDPTLTYRIEFAVRASVINDASIAKDFGNGWTVRIGQYEVPFTRERLISSSRQLAVDRSLVHGVFNLGYSQGILADYEGDRWRLAGSWDNGARRRNRSALALDTVLSVTGRAEYLAAGSWKQFNEFTSPRGTESGLLLGAAIHYEKDEHGTPGFEEERLAWTADASVGLNGASVFAAVNWDHLMSNDPSTSDVHQVGLVVQGGTYLAESWEVFARYEWSDLDTPGASNLSVITFGLNHYMHGQRLKWASDVGIGLNPVALRFAATGPNWRTDAPGQNGQVVIRSQLQLLF